jgi:RimJ/RimL family protein N-acetyltransferase
VCRFLMALDWQDRYRRFCRPMADPEIVSYAARIDWSETVLLGAFNHNAELIGLLELCDGGRCAEIGLAVHRQYREQGVAKALMHRALLEATLLGKARVVLSCLSENIAMRRLARSVGLRAAGGSAQANAEAELDRVALIESVGEAMHEPGGNITYAAAL